MLFSAPYLTNVCHGVRRNQYLRLEAFAARNPHPSFNGSPAHSLYVLTPVDDVRQRAGRGARGPMSAVRVLLQQGFEGDAVAGFGDVSACSVVLQPFWARESCRLLTSRSRLSRRVGRSTKTSNAWPLRGCASAALCSDNSCVRQNDNGAC